MKAADARLCLITDRHRLGEALGIPPEARGEALLEQIAAAGAAGIDFVQIRERDLDARALLDLARRARALLATTSSRLLVNDRIDVALASDAGVHLREDSVPAARARQIMGGSALIGRSVHDAAGARQAGAVDFLVAAPVFPSASKPGRRDWLGAGGLRAIVAAAGEVPVFALGGIHAGNVTAVGEAGAAGVAAIGAFIPARPGEDLVEIMHCAAAALRIPL